MEIILEKRDDAHVFKVVGEMTIYNAVELHGRLIDALKEPNAIELDLSGASDFDSSAFQILYAAKKECKALGKGFKVLSASSAVVTTLEMYRMKEEFL